MCKKTISWKWRNRFPYFDEIFLPVNEQQQNSEVLELWLGKYHRYHHHQLLFIIIWIYSLFDTRHYRYHSWHWRYMFVFVCMCDPIFDYEGFCLLYFSNICIQLTVETVDPFTIAITIDGLLLFWILELVNWMQQ